MGAGRRIKTGVIRFPGTNCDRDVFRALQALGKNPVWLWHEDQFDAKEFDGVVLPGGFSYGDYLRSGALAARAPVMKSVREAAKMGRTVLGICNGFQILCEARLLDGVLTKNQSLRFMDQWVELEWKNSKGAIAGQAGQRLKIPIAHADGCYRTGDPSGETLKRLQESDQIVFTYVENPNGSEGSIAGLQNLQGNVVGMMPHPERAMAEWMGGVDGQAILGGF